jgi:hypothetical protein
MLILKEIKSQAVAFSRLLNNDLCHASHLTFYFFQKKCNIFSFLTSNLMSRRHLYNRSHSTVGETGIKTGFSRENPFLNQVELK